MKYEPDALVVEVRNNPPRNGFAAGAPGVGLIGLGERVRVAGGMLHVAPLPAGGFRIAAVLPYEDTPVADEPDDERTRPDRRGGDGSPVRKWAGVGSIVGPGWWCSWSSAATPGLGTQPVTKVVS